MWSENDVFQATKVLSPRIQASCEMRSVSTWFTWVHIQGCSSDFSGSCRIDESRNINDAPSTGIDEITSILHLLKLLFANEIAGLWEFRYVACNEVCGVQEFIECGHLSGSTQSHQIDDIVIDDRHPHSFRQNR